MITSTQTQEAPQIWIDLDQPPLERFKGFFPRFTADLSQYCDKFLDVLNKEFDALQYFEDLSLTHHDKQLIDDTLAIAQLTGIEFRKLYAIQFMYDFGSLAKKVIYQGCTSIIVTRNSGQPYIVRNLDYNFQQLIKRLTVRATFYRSTKDNIVMETMAIVGQISVTHTVTTKYFSATLNQLTSMISNEDLQKGIVSLNSNSAIRELYLAALESTSFQQFKTRIMNAKVNAQALIIMVGLQNEDSAIIHLEDWNGDVIEKPKEQSLDGQLFILATNDYDSKESVGRLTAAKERLSKMSVEELQDPLQVVSSVLAQPPNKNILTIAAGILEPISQTTGMAVYLY